MSLQEPDRLIRGNWFESDEQMKQYKVGTTSGYMPMKTSSTAPNPTEKDTVEKEELQPTTTRVKQEEVTPIAEPKPTNFKRPLLKAGPQKVPAFNLKQKPTLLCAKVLQTASKNRAITNRAPHVLSKYLLKE